MTTSSTTTKAENDDGKKNKKNNDVDKTTIATKSSTTMEEEEEEKLKTKMNIKNHQKSIVEGSCEMIYDTNEESSVFYNPVQVQNRDLSILMISLFVERYCIRLLQHEQQQQQKQQERKKNKEQKQKQKQEQEPKQQENEPKQTERMEIVDDNNQVEEIKTPIIPTTDGKEAVQQVLLLLQQQQKNHDDCKNSTSSCGIISILDALAASGLRSIRYYKEINGINHITINDCEKAAIDRAYQNIRHNQLHHCITNNRNTSGIRINYNDALYEMYNSRPSIIIPDPDTSNNTTAPTNHFAPYNVIDLDPYGSAAPFLDAAIQALDHQIPSNNNNNNNNNNSKRHNTMPGFLCVTCTDMAALGGSHPETAFGRYYGSMPIPSAGYLQEMAIRILLHSIAMTASKYGKVIRPVLSVGMNFYIRVFVEVIPNKADINLLSIDKIGYVYQSTQCPSYYIVPAGKLGGKKGTAYQPGRMPTIDIIRKTNNNNTNDSNNNNNENDDEGDNDKNDSDKSNNHMNAKKQKREQQLNQQQHSIDQQHIGCCQETGSTFKIGGPIWIGPMHDQAVIEEALKRINDHKKATSKKGTSENTDNSASSNKNNQNSYEENEGSVSSSVTGSCKDDVMKYITTGDRIHGLLLSCQEELIDVPLFYRLPDLSQVLHVSTVPLAKFRSALINAGYEVSGYHKEPQAIKTNAPNAVIWDIMKAWVRLNPPKNPIPPNSIASKILATEPVILKDVDFTIRSNNINNNNNNAKQQQKHVARFPMNPQANWGPKPAAKGYKNKSPTNNPTIISINDNNNNNNITQNEISNDNSNPKRKLEECLEEIKE